MTGAYVAYAIDQANVHETRAQANGARYWLREQPEISWVFDPGRAFAVNVAADRDPGIRAINAEALARAGVVVAFLPSGVSSVGVPMEIDRAVRAGKVVCVVSDAPSWMLEFEEENAAVFHAWGSKAQEWVSEALRGVSRNLSSRPRASLPVLLSEGSEVPRRGYADDAGLDLIVSEEEVVVYPGEFVDIRCGVSVQLPQGVWGMLTGRSSTLRKRGLLVNQGIIDTGYRGPLYAGVWNMIDDPVRVVRGDRIAQLILLPNITQQYEVERVWELDPSERGSSGFGSTGS